MQSFGKVIRAKRVTGTSAGGTRGRTSSLPPISCSVIPAAALLCGTMDVIIYRRCYCSSLLPINAYYQHLIISESFALHVVVHKPAIHVSLLRFVSPPGFIEADISLCTEQLKSQSWDTIPITSSAHLKPERQSELDIAEMCSDVTHPASHHSTWYRHI
ncbi:hypothetical protein E2C01_042770 [Portunus trituberculatus]|uniref:Uncharacterized protein n=1 Tax=Portunus trituberculatus TaxID=210409 RepID=A0A5B7FVJ2_PORTR|nr:hypothetical protein [Portunus trituberculatus]